MTVIQRTPNLGIGIRLQREGTGPSGGSNGGLSAGSGSAQPPHWAGYIDASGRPMTDLAYDFDPGGSSRLVAGVWVGVVPGVAEVEWEVRYALRWLDHYWDWDDDAVKPVRIELGEETYPATAPQQQPATTPSYTQPDWWYETLAMPQLYHQDPWPGVLVRREVPQEDGYNKKAIGYLPTVIRAGNTLCVRIPQAFGEAEPLTDEDWEAGWRFSPVWAGLLTATARYGATTLGTITLDLNVPPTYE